MNRLSVFEGFLQLIDSLKECTHPLSKDRPHLAELTIAFSFLGHFVPYITRNVNETCPTVLSS